jgi:phosphoribosylformylglycinamidine cyclo-ligase
MRTTEVHAFSHVTGGGLAANLARVVPDELHAIVDRSTWTPGPVFDLVGRTGNVERLELEKTLNMGVGMIAIVPQESTDVALATLADRGVDAWVAGEITDRGEHTTGAALIGDYAN